MASFSVQAVSFFLAGLIYINSHLYLPFGPLTLPLRILSSTNNYQPTCPYSFLILHAFYVLVLEVISADHQLLW